MTNFDRIESRLDRIETLLTQSYNAERWLSLRDACRYSGLSDSTLRRLVVAGKLRCSKQSGKLLFRTIWIDKALLFGRQRLTKGERKEFLGEFGQ